ncbi:hypothetical protein J007_00876 [Cryptococcus neoformans]|nr:hypothetical protein J007_00876 [Cryptococcus neoformans var. grubii]OXC64644.1 hypothetical protein C358_00877 [Cryptococcus neoformans var. grubii MW-RSA852]
MRRDESLELATNANTRKGETNEYTNWMTRRIRPFAHVSSPLVIVNAKQAFHSLSIPRPHVVALILHVNLRLVSSLVLAPAIPASPSEDYPFTTVYFPSRLSLR